jgi:hypothetical protein
MTFTCPQQSSLTDSELDKIYSGTKPGLLPNPPNGSSDRDANNMLSANAVTRIITTHKSAGTIPNSNSNNTDAMVAAQTEFLTNIKAEYCFYDSRYKYSLEKLFSAVRAAYQNNSADAQSVIQKYLAFTQRFNQRLNDLTQIINSVTDGMLQASNTISKDIQDFNTRVQELKVKLDEQNSIISSGEAMMKIKKQMVKFTEEKARRSDNLLKLYGFMNIVTIGLLVYVYRAASDQ